jgi:hypothetical protein
MGSGNTNGARTLEVAMVGQSKKGLFLRQGKPSSRNALLWMTAKG